MTFGYMREKRKGKKGLQGVGDLSNPRLFGLDFVFVLSAKRLF
jgi:hypothetical protein